VAAGSGSPGGAAGRRSRFEEQSVDGDQDAGPGHGQGRDLGPEHQPERRLEDPAAMGSAIAL